MGPHNKQTLIDNLKRQKEEVQAMPKVPEQVVEEEEFDLEKELADLAATIEQAPQPERPLQLAPEEALRLRILEALDKHPDAPTKEKIEEWKAKYGDEGIHLIAFDEQNVFIHTYLTNPQWEKIAKMNEQLAQQPNQNVEKAMREAVLRYGILFPKIGPTWFETCRAGLPNTLYEAILLHSYFITPAHALSLTTKL